MKKKLLHHSIFLALILVSSIGYSQKKVASIKDSVLAVSAISFHGGYTIPGGAMQELYGPGAVVGLGYSYKNKSNWIFTFDANFIFGNNIKNDSIFADFMNSNNQITGVTGLVADIKTYQRGMAFNARIGKILPVFGPNPNSGILITGGIGFLQHKIRIEDQFVEAPLISYPNTDDTFNYKHGYDRLTNGFSLSEFVGYQYFGNKRRINFYTGFEFTQGYTKNRRSANYDTKEMNFDYQWDFMTAIKFGINIPIYQQSPQEYYYH